MIRYFSMFSGIGGFELGIDRAIRQLQQELARHDDSQNDKNERGLLNSGATCVGYSEIDKYATKVYERQFNGHTNYGDATLINERELPDFDLLVGGFPCQAFSVAGKRRGFEDTRGTLFFEIARILKHKRPRHLVLENVKGLLSHDQGKTFQTILGVLSDIGYLVEWQVLNSKDFGVPQNRERVFIVGHLGGECRPKVFPIRNHNTETLKQIIGGSQGFRVYDQDGVATTQASQAGGLGAKTGLYAISQTNRRTKARLSKTCNTLTSRFTGQPDGDGRPAIAVLTPDRLNKRQNGRRFKTNGEPAFTVNTQDRHGIYDGMLIRRLTPKECERLQGFPDDWTKYGLDKSLPNHKNPDGTTYRELTPISDTQRYKMCGNAVTTNVVQAVMEKLYGKQ